MVEKKINDIRTKVAFITNYWINSSGGGVLVYTTNLIASLKKLDTSLDISIIFREGIDFQNYCPSKNRIIFILNATKYLFKIKPNVIHTQGGWFTEVPAAVYKMSHKNTNLICTFHTEPKKKMPLYKRIFYNVLLNRFDYITFVSMDLKRKTEKISGLNIKTKKVITYAGVDSKKISEYIKYKFIKKYNIKNKSPILLANGLTASAYKAKGAELLIRSIKELINIYPNIVLILTRDGLYSNQLQDFAKNEGVYENMVFTGDLENPYVPLSLCDIYTHVTLEEGGVSIALLEAMSMGKPIIATPVGGIPEAITTGVNGILVDPDSRAIAEKIVYLLDNKEVSEMIGICAYKTSLDKFTWDKSAEKFLKIYRDLL